MADREREKLVDIKGENDQGHTLNTEDEGFSFIQESELREGTRVDRYLIIELIGKGGMGAVYKAYDPELDRRIAIKIMIVSPHKGETASVPQVRLMREAQALAKLNHPNVVSIFDVGTYEDGVYIAMEYVEGQTLREWINKQRPSIKQIVDVFLAAGLGLQSAHSVGIVHRDFKPDNVLVGRNGRVKVVDFGLARAAGLQSLDPTLSEPVSELESGDQFLNQPLTQAGAKVGTIAYMAPEHFTSQELDEQTDQFSFCVTLFEALYGTRPFPGANLREFEHNLIRSRIRFPKESSVPAWITEIVRKGLSALKRERYPSMSCLLDALGHDPEVAKSQKRRRILLAVAFVFAALVCVGIGGIIFDQTQVCTGADDKLIGVWDQEKKERVKQSFAKTTLFFSEDSYSRVAQRLDHYLQKWKNEYIKTCEATHVHGEQSEEVLDLKMDCLNRHLKNVGALANVFVEADKVVVSKAVQAVASLADFSNCHDTQALRATIPPPDNLSTKIQVEQIRDNLSRVDALQQAGKYREGLDLAQQLKQEAQGVAYRPLEAEVLYRLGHLLDSVGDFTKAQTVLRKAARIAGECRNSRLAASALVLLIPVVGYRLARHQAGMQIGEDAQVVLGLAGGDESIKANLLNNLAAVFHDQGDYQKALENYRRALEIRKKVLGPDHLLVAHSLNNLGLVFLRQGEFQKALDYLRNTLEIKEKILGPDHPRIVSTLTNLALVFLRQGNTHQAVEYLRDALRIQEAVLGSDHPRLVPTLILKGLVMLRQGEHTQALKDANKALQISYQSLGAEHPLAAAARCGIGMIWADLGNAQQSLEYLEPAIQICEKKNCEPEMFAHGLFSLARVLAMTGRQPARALKLASKARKLFEKAPREFILEIDQVDTWLKKHQNHSKAD